MRNRSRRAFRGRPSRLGGVLGALAVVGLVSGGGPSGYGALAAVTARGVSVTSSVTPSALSFGGAPATATLVLTTGPQPQTAAVGVEPSGWPDRMTIGSPLRVTDQQISGAGQQTGGYAAGGTATQAGASVCRRGASQYEGGGIDLSLPADSTTTISWQVTLAAPSWLGQQLSLGWIVGVPATARDSRLVTMRQVGPDPLTPTGPTGVRITLHAGPGTRTARPRSGLPYPRVQVGRAVQIDGATHPTLPDTRIDVGTIATRSHHRTPIAIVTTRHDGTFATTWRPPHPGNDTITAAVSDPPAGTLPDRSCDLALTVSRR